SHEQHAVRRERRLAQDQDVGSVLRAGRWRVRGALVEQSDHRRREEGEPPDQQRPERQLEQGARLDQGVAPREGERVEAPRAATGRHRRRPLVASPLQRGFGVLAVLLWLVVLAAAAGAYLWAMWTWSYASGERAGWVQKFSYKGWICKTWEGEMAMV